MEFTFIINEEIDRIFIFDDKMKIGYGDLSNGGVNCPLYGCKALELEIKKYQKTSLKYVLFRKEALLKKINKHKTEVYDALDELEKIEKEEKKLLETVENKKEKTQSLLDKAKELYPVGTKLVSHFGATDEVVEDENFLTHYWDGDGTSIMVKCKRDNRIVYDFLSPHLGWAKVIS